MPGTSSSYVIDTVYILRGDLLSIIVATITTADPADEGFFAFVDGMAQAADDKLALIAY